MKGRGPLIAAITLGIAAAFFYWLDLSTAKRQATKDWQLEPAIVAAQDIEEGTVLTADMVAQRGIPKQFITSSVIQVENFHFIAGQKVVVPLKRGDPLQWSQFESSKGLERLSDAVQKSFRAMTLPASEINGVGGWIRPNDHIDIQLTYHDAQRAQISTLTILENMLVLATGTITGTTNMNLMSPQERKYSNLTLLVLPEEAEILNLAQDVGKISFVLRNGTDLQIQPKREMTSVQTILNGERLPLIQAKKKAAQQGIQVITGGR